ncbi:MAG: hypothetical protein WCK63_03935 [Betaproteobacteria bacterium]
MTTELISNWAEHDIALCRILPELSQSLRIFADDLTRLDLERPEIADSLRHFLAADAQNTLKIVLKNSESFSRNSPRLMNLLRSYPDRMTVIAAPDHLASLSDNIVLVDDRHALIRFHQDHVRSKLIVDNAAECLPYAQRFDAIIREGGEPISATTLGL